MLFYWVICLFCGLATAKASILRLDPEKTLVTGNTYLWRGGRHRGLINIYSDEPVTLIVPCAEELVPNFVFTCDNDPETVDEEAAFGGNQVVDEALFFCVKKMRTFSCSEKLTLTLHKRDVFGVIAKEQHFSIIDMSLRFPFASQLVRAWQGQYLFGYLMLLFTTFYVLSVYRFQRLKFKIPDFLLSYGAVSLFAWVIDSFVQMLYLSAYIDGRAIIGFILNVVINTVLILAIIFVSKSLIVRLVVASISTIVGGGGGYICPIFAFLAAFLSRAKCPDRTFICKE